MGCLCWTCDKAHNGSNDWTSNETCDWIRGSRSWIGIPVVPAVGMLPGFRVGLRTASPEGLPVG